MYCLPENIQKKKLLENNKCIFYYNNNKIYIGEVEMDMVNNK